MRVLIKTGSTNDCLIALKYMKNKHYLYPETFADAFIAKVEEFKAKEQEIQQLLINDDYLAEKDAKALQKDNSFPYESVIEEDKNERVENNERIRPTDGAKKKNRGKNTRAKK